MNGILALSDVFWLQLVTAVPTTIAALATLVVAIRTTLQLRAVHTQINSRMDQLVEATADASHAAGEKKGTNIERDRKDVIAVAAGAAAPGGQASAVHDGDTVVVKKETK